MIRTYTVKELENLSGLTRRTIGDYVAKGLLSGPSHRGRGACYSQGDVDVLRVIPRLRVLMKKEFPSLRALRNFLAQLSSRDIHGLARKTSPDSFVLAVRQLRLRILLATMLPQVSPDRIDMELAALSPEQVRAVDTGRTQLGSVIDMSRLLKTDGHAYAAEEITHSDVWPAHTNGNGHRHGNGHYFSKENSSHRNPEVTATNPWLNSTWAVGWLHDQAETGSRDTRSQEAFQSSASVPLAEYNEVNGHSNPIRRESHGDRLSDIARRLERLERLLSTD